MRDSTEARALRVNVALAPALVRPQHPHHPYTTYVIVDVIRATTTLSVFCERGARRIFVANDVPAVRAIHARLQADALLAGEVDGARPDGFDLGNSPAEAATRDLRDRDIFFATTNGTRALHACNGGGAILTGAFRNASAVAAAAVRAADALLAATPDARLPTEEPLEGHDAFDIVVVCSGRGDQPAYDDTICAGYLAERIARHLADAGRASRLGEAARLAVAALHDATTTTTTTTTTRGTLRDALADSDAARALSRIGLGDDVDWCAQVDTSPFVPTLTHTDPASGLPVLEPREG